MKHTLLAWCVHLYTATGLIAAAGMVVLMILGGDRNFRGALLLMIVATIIDSTDGTLARRLDVRRWTPGFDGRRLDDITDFHTYTSIPLLFIWLSGIVSGALAWWLLIPLIASAYGFSQTDAKTKDGYFLGFPSYWNVVAFYFYFLRPTPAVAVMICIILAILTFVPFRYLYPSYGGRFAMTTIVLGSIWGLLLILIVAGVFEPPQAAAWISFTFPAWYLIISWGISIARVRNAGFPLTK
jgi:phosphatidylcholine synthase